MKKAKHTEVKIEKLVHGGQGLGTMPEGRKIFVWNALPGETLKVRITRSKKDFAEGIAEEIIESKIRKDAEISDIDLATQPWVILGWSEELAAKVDIVRELFDREKIKLPKFDCQVFGGLSGYRNKMEYGFWGDDNGISFAHFKRGSHGKISVTESILATDAMNVGCFDLLQILNQTDVRAGDLKSFIIRGENMDTVGALFVKTKDFPMLESIGSLKGLAVYYSEPKSPASVPTKELYRIGDTTLTSEFNKIKLKYDVLSFFQVNKPIFQLALDDMVKHIESGKKYIDMYGGVGTIGLSLGLKDLTIVELDEANTEFAEVNAKANKNKAEVVQASTENALDYITKDVNIIFDPPRSGLHKKIIERIEEQKPKQIIYLSCNPATQARDISLLSEIYKIVDFKCYNFFPRTPHIETLAILELKGQN